MEREMETSTAWMLFVLTGMIHAGTFIFVQEVANGFKQYISATGGMNHTPGSILSDDGSEPTMLELHTTNTPPGPDATRHHTQPLQNSAGHYQDARQYKPLHDILDVSIFR